MSRIYFHSQNGETELHGSERAYLDGICRRFAASVYNVDGGFRDIERAGRIMEIIPASGNSSATDLHELYHLAVAEEARHKKANEGRTGGFGSYIPINPQPGDFFIRQLSMYLDGMGFSDSPFVVGDFVLDAGNVSLNTALVGGSDELALAAKIHGYCESHAFVEGEDRNWLADIMQSGLDKGIYRRIVDNIGGVKQGWENVIELLRSRDDEPVVMSYSVCDSFPNLYELDFESDYNDGIRYEKWEALGDEKRWELSMAALRENHPYLQISPKNLRGRMFHYPVSAYDIVHADRDERIKEACSSKVDA